MNRYLRVFSTTLMFILMLAIGSTGNGYANTPLSSFTAVDPPTLKILPLFTPPTDLKVSISENLSGGNAYNLSWKDNSNNESGFVLERTPHLGAPFVLAARYPANVTTATFAQETGTTYFYQIRAYMDNGKTVSDATNAVTIVGPPFAPTNLTAVPGPGPKNGIQLKWDNPESNKGLDVTWIITRGGDGDTQTFLSHSTSYLDESVKSKVNYGYRVCGMTLGGRSPLTDSAVLTLLEVPTNLTAGIWPSISGEGKLSISWDDNCNVEEGYRISILPKYADGVKPVLIEVPANTTRYDYPFMMVCEHEIKIQAFMKSGKTSTWSNVFYWTPTFLQKAPTASKITSINAINGSAEVHFEDTFVYVQTYKLERKEGNGPFVNVLSAVAYNNNNVLKDKGLKAGTTYTYRLKVTNSYGGSPYSNEMKITTAPDSKPTQPNAPPVQPALPPQTVETDQTEVKPTTKPIVPPTVTSETGIDIQTDTTTASVSEPIDSKVPDAISFKLGSSKMMVKGIAKDIEPGKSTKPVVTQSGRTMIPIRSMVEELGGTVEWVGAENKVILKLDGNVVELIIGDKQAQVNGVATLSEEAPQIINGRTMLPLRFVGESLGLDVQWDPDTQNITIQP